MTETPKNVLVETKSAWLSKINLTQLIAMVAMLLAYFGFEVSATTQAEILAAIVAVQSVITWVLKTWFTTTITPSAAAKA